MLKNIKNRKLLCIIFRARKISRLLVGFLAMAMVILGTCDNMNAWSALMAFVGLAIVIYLAATFMRGIYTDDGIRIRRVK
jgi:hypothetical protein